MTDDEAEAAALDKHFDDDDSYSSGAECRAFEGGFRAGLAHARRWRPLTDDPKTWPEEGQCVLLRSTSLHEEDAMCRRITGTRALLVSCGWTHWLPLPLPPPSEEADGG